MTSPESCAFLNRQLTEVPNMTFEVNVYLECMIGSPAQLNNAVLLTCLYSLLLLTGLAGNIATMIRIIQSKRGQTPTNCYIASLAASDVFILLLGTTEEIYRFWSQYPWNFGIFFCQLKNMASEMFLYISILTIMAFTIERYIAIVHPLFQRQFMTSRKSRIYKVVILIWIVSFINSLPYGIYSEINYVPHPSTGAAIEESAHCQLPWREKIVQQFLEYSFAAFFVLPLLLLTFFYIRIGLAISRNSLGQSVETSHTERSTVSRALSSTKSNHIEEGASHSPTRSRCTVSVIKMLVGIVTSFFICFSVFHAQRLLTIWSDWSNASDSLKSAYTILHMTSGTLYYLNPSLNPVMYFWHTNKFQRGFHACLRPCGLKLDDRNFRSSVSNGSRLTAKAANSFQLHDSQNDSPANRPSYI